MRVGNLKLFRFRFVTFGGFVALDRDLAGPAYGDKMQCQSFIKIGFCALLVMLALHGAVSDEFNFHILV